MSKITSEIVTNNIGRFIIYAGKYLLLEETGNSPSPNAFYIKGRLFKSKEVKKFHIFPYSIGSIQLDDGTDFVLSRLNKLRKENVAESEMESVILREFIDKLSTMTGHIVQYNYQFHKILNASMNLTFLQEVGSSRSDTRNYFVTIKNFEVINNFKFLSYEEAAKHCGLKVGDKVKVVRAARNDEDYNYDWLAQMNSYIGKVHIIKDIHNYSYDLGSNAVIYTFLFPYFVLEKIEEEEIENGDDPVVSEDQVKEFVPTHRLKYKHEYTEEELNKHGSVLKNNYGMILNEENQKQYDRKDVTYTLFYGKNSEPFFVGKTNVVEISEKDRGKNMPMENVRSSESETDVLIRDLSLKGIGDVGSKKVGSLNNIDIYSTTSGQSNMACKNNQEFEIGNINIVSLSNIGYILKKPITLSIDTWRVEWPVIRFSSPLTVKAEFKFSKQIANHEKLVESYDEYKIPECKRNQKSRYSKEIQYEKLSPEFAEKWTMDRK